MVANVHGFMAQNLSAGLVIAAVSIEFFPMLGVFILRTCMT